MKDVMFTNLTGYDFDDPTPKPIDGFAPGSFTDMRGRKIKIEPDELIEYVANTKAALESTRDSTGRIVGFPIDQKGHDEGDAAGFITDVFEDGGVIRFDVRWNEIGKYLIENELERYFSATFDPKQKVIVGGSLTNWPATRTPDHKILLRPVELSANMQALEGVEAEEIPLTESIKLALIEVLSGLGFKKPAPDKNPIPEEDVVEKTEMSAEELEQIRADAIKDLVSNPEASAELSSYLETEVERRMAERLQAEQRKAHIVDFCARIVGGTEDNPQGLPVVQEKMVDLMTRLPVELEQEVEELLTQVIEKKLISFKEQGHAKQLKGGIKLPEEMKEIYRTSGLSLQKFFEANAPELGAMEDYDLSEFEKKEN